MPRLFVLHDSDEEQRRLHGAREVDSEEARCLNAEGWGVFWVPNVFGERRVQTSLREIRFWFCEMDEGTKKEQAARLKRSPLLPSAVVESARGYHAYWRVRGSATPTGWRRIVRWGLVPELRGDPKATDVLRLLRCPGYSHMKDPEHPHPVRTVWKLDASYTEQQMMRAFKSREPVVTREARTLAPGEGGFWERVATMDAREALVRLNGHWLMNGESFHLREQSNGNANVVRTDGYDTGTFVDRAGRLGNVDGGSSIAAWCAWYGHDWATVAKGLREAFPELGERE